MKLRTAFEVVFATQVAAVGAEITFRILGLQDWFTSEVDRFVAFATLSQFLAVGFVWTILFWRHPRLLRVDSPAGFGRTAPAEITLALATGVCALALALGIAYLRPSQDVSMVARVMDHATPYALGLFIFQLFCVAAVVEEYVFRGVTYSLLKGQWGAGTAILVTSILFALLHVPGTPDPLSVFAQVFVLAMAAQWLRWRTGKLGPAIVVHATYNGGIVVLLAARWAFPDL